MDFLVGCCAAWSGILTPTVVDAMQCLTMVQLPRGRLSNGRKRPATEALKTGRQHRDASAFDP